MISAGGLTQTYCEEHQREYWRETARAKRPANSSQLNDSIGDNGTAVEAAHAETVAKTSRPSDADKQRMIDESRARVQTTKAAVSKPPVPFEELIRTARLSEPEKQHMLTRDSSPANDELPEKVYQQLGIPIPAKTTLASKPDECAIGGCNDCLYRDVVEMLEKRVPGVRELVDGLKTIHGQK